MSSDTSEPSTTIASQVAALHKGRSSDNVWAVEQAALSGTTVTPTLPLGADFPDGELLSPTGEPTTLDATLNGSAAVIVFYRRAWCPYCNLALATYRSHLRKPLAQRGIVLVALSPQMPDGTLTMQEKHGLDFAVLSDQIVPDAFQSALTLNVVIPAALSAFFSPGMCERGWGRIVNVSSGIAAHPDIMIGGNSYATTKAALEAHTVNLAAELAGTGVTVNIYRRGSWTPRCRHGFAVRNPHRSVSNSMRDSLAIRIRARCSPQRSLAVHLWHICPAQTLGRSGMSRTSFRNNFHVA